jgi:hypothetical protein
VNKLSAAADGICAQECPLTFSERELRAFDLCSHKARAMDTHKTLFLVRNGAENYCGREWKIDMGM